MHPRLEGEGDTSRVLKIGSLPEAEAAKRELAAIVRAWCDWRAAEGAAGASAKPARAARKPAPKRAATAKKKRANA
jgi:hypothetical protein